MFNKNKRHLVDIILRLDLDGISNYLSDPVGSPSEGDYDWRRSTKPLRLQILPNSFNEAPLVFHCNERIFANRLDFNFLWHGLEVELTDSNGYLCLYVDRKIMGLAPSYQLTKMIAGNYETDKIILDWEAYDFKDSANQGSSIPVEDWHVKIKQHTASVDFVSRFFYISFQSHKEGNFDICYENFEASRR